MNDKPLEDMQPEANKITFLVFTIAILFGLTVFVMAIYGTWAIYDRQEIRQQLVDQTALAELRGAVITKNIEEIKKLKFSQRWDILLGILLNKDRQVEFDLIEDHLKQKVLNGTIRTFEKNNTLKKY